MLYVSSIGAYVDQCEWLERATPHPSKRCAMLLSMSPRRSWRSMLTSFACEQIVQVWASEPTPRARACRAPVEIYSGTGSRAQPRKGPAHGAGNDVRKLRLRANGGSIERHIRAQQESYEGLSANTNDGTTHLFGSLGRSGTRPHVKNEIPFHGLLEGV